METDNPTPPESAEVDTSPPATSDASGPTGIVTPVGVRPVDLRDYVRFERGQATRVRVFATDSMTLDLWGLEPRQSTEVLLFERTDCTYTVLGGHCWFITDEGEVGLEPMGSILVPAGVAHGFDNRHADPLILLATTCPPVVGDDRREDEPVTDKQLAVRAPYQRRSLSSRLRETLRREGEVLPGEPET